MLFCNVASRLTTTETNNVHSRVLLYKLFMCVAAAAGWAGAWVGEATFCCTEGTGEGNGACGPLSLVDGNPAATEERIQDKSFNDAKT